jgi:hypothetical protein
MKVNAAKLAIAKQQIEFLGIVWHKGSLNIPNARISAFRNIPYPSTPKKLKAILDAISVYKNFIPRFAEHSNPLQELSALHHKQFNWNKKHQTAFDYLIDKISQQTSLNSPNQSKPFFVQSDASDVAGAGRVFQQDDQGHELLLACISRPFTTQERSLSIFKKEVTALLYTLKALDFYLKSAKKIMILIDAKSIIYLCLCRQSEGILLDFSLELSKLDAEIHHVPGPENVVSDVLSRQHKDLDTILQETKYRNVLSE